ncbi:MAG: TRAP transporter large permease subunit [Boseongicola sp. SB0676_bin_33]|nr:TRAP transporter large permease subunit [Boseongicola sp. SB0676_bin_33]
MTCLSGSHSFQLFTCVLSGDQFTVFFLFGRPARSRPLPTIDLVAVDGLRNRMANRQSAEFDRETFGDRSGYSQQHRALHVTAFGEAAAMGVVASLLLIWVRNELSTVMVLEGLEQTFRSVGTILWVAFGATVLAGAFSLSGGNRFVANAIVGLDVAPLVIILVMMCIFFILGLFMYWICIVLLTMPVFMPIVKQLGYDPIWFGILFSVNMQISFLTPPFGSAAFYLKSVAPPEIDLVTIYRSFGPFILLQAMILAILVAFPQISLFLVR